MATYCYVTVTKSATINHNSNYSSSSALKITFDALKVPKGTTAHSWKIDVADGNHRRYLICKGVAWNTYSSKNNFDDMK